MRNEANSPIKISEHLNKWLECIRSLDYPQAIQQKEIIDTLLEKIDVDARLIAYYNLVDYKHRLAIEHQMLDEENIDQPSPTDRALLFLYYDYLGQVAFNQRRYVKAIEYYALAENYLTTECELEKAEFYKRLGTSYYRINQNVFALSFIRDANKIFSRNANYKELELNCYVLIGGIYDDLGHYEKAQETYKIALEESEKYPLTKALILRALGTSKFKEQNFIKSKEYFEETLAITLSDLLIAAKTSIDLAHNMLIIESDLQRAKALLDEAELFTREQNDVEYSCRASIIRSLYVTGQLNDIEWSLKQLEKANLFAEAGEVSIELSNYFRVNGQLDQALIFLDRSEHYKVQSNLLLIEEEEIS